MTTDVEMIMTMTERWDRRENDMGDDDIKSSIKPVTVGLEQLQRNCLVQQQSQFRRQDG